MGMWRGRGGGGNGEGGQMHFHCHWTVKRRWDPRRVSLAQPPSQTLKSSRLVLIITIDVNNMYRVSERDVAGTEITLNHMQSHNKCH